MTEAEWLACTDPGKMLGFLHTGTFSGRRFRLFACACTRQIWHLLTDSRSREAIVLAEKLADGHITRLKVAEGSFRDDAQAVTRECETDAAKAARKTLRRSAKIAASDTAWIAARAQWANDDTDLEDQQLLRNKIQAAQCLLLRCIFGNPFCPIAIDRSWLSSTVKQLAETVYQDRAYARLPILADALEDAGCDSLEILGHLRIGGEHVGGCWALDLVLGRE